MTRPVHIASVNQDPGIRPDRHKGAAVHLRAMRRAFRQLGAEVSEVDNPENVQSSLAELAAQRPLDLVYERYALGRAGAARFARDTGLPYALEVNAPLADEQERWRGRPEHARDARHDAEAFGAAGFIAAVSQTVADYALQRGGDLLSIHVCPNGVETELFNPGAGRTEAPELSLPEGAFVLGFHGRERPWHGFELLADAVGDLLRAGVPAHLLVIGKGDFDALGQLPPGAWTRLNWVDYEQVPACISRFDVLPLTYPPGLPCYFSPLKLAEAMACGAVPVVPGLGDLPQAVEHGKTGLVYAAGDRKALVRSLQALHDDPGLRARLSSAAAAAAARQGWDRIAARILAHFGLAGGGAP